jgi:multidrug efflux pump subunit AcrA (membrane-fusion protein)
MPPIVRYRLPKRWSAIGYLLLAGGAAGLPSHTAAFQSESGEQEVVIKRESLRLTDPKIYRVSLHLEAARSLVLTAPEDGVVRTVTARPRQKLKQQSEAIRFDDRRAALVLRRAKANLQAAQLEKKIAQGKGDADQVALAEARIESAQAGADLAQLDADRLIVRAPFNGEIERVFVAEGQFVRAGERLATLIDPSKLTVEVPVDRSAAIPGNTIEIKVEETAVKAKVEAILPLAPQFDPLRELAVSPASAVVSIDNAAGSFSGGQTVYAELVPLAPVTQVPALAVGNVPDGNRKVQVLRDNVVRDLTVRILGKVGTDSVFVSGRFSEGDEVIVSSTRSLADGTPLRALAAGPVAAQGKVSGRRIDAVPSGGESKKPSIGF